MKPAGPQYTRVGPDFPEGKTWDLASVTTGKPKKDPGVSCAMETENERG